MNMTLLVIAKAPVPGRVKTRLCPPCTFEEAASIAESALLDTLSTVCSTPADRYTIALHGEPSAQLAAALDGFEIFEQRGDGLGERLMNAFDDVFLSAKVASRVVLVGMDSPQLCVEHLVAADRNLDYHDAVLGLAEDGGWWIIGFASHQPKAFEDVPMSDSTTGAAQHAALTRLQLNVATLPTLRDVDTFDDALAVANLAPGGRFAAQVKMVAQRVAKSTLADTRLP